MTALVIRQATTGRLRGEFLVLGSYIASQWPRMPIISCHGTRRVGSWQWALGSNEGEKR
jgi:hypothetical protein